VIGYTDNMPVGAPLQGVGIADNTQLSLKRASEAVAFFQSQGVNPSLLDAAGIPIRRPDVARPPAPPGHGAPPFVRQSGASCSG
jgi:flagellar motor protein MotB